MQVELDSGKRVKVKSRQRAVALRRSRAPAALLASARVRWPAKSTSTWLGNSRPTASSASPIWRATTSTRTPTRCIRPPRCSAVRRAALFPPPRQGRVPQGAAKNRARRRCSASSARREQAAQVERLGRRAGRGPVCPAPIREQLYRILFKPDKNAPEYKAVVEAAQTGAARAARPADALPVRSTAPYQFHWRRFLFEQFPQRPRLPADWRRCPIRKTTAAGRRAGVLDRRSARPPRSTTRCRCKVSAAALSCSASTSPRRRWPSRPTRALDKVARERLSTVYMPGYKITMLPDARRAGLHAAARAATARR